MNFDVSPKENTNFSRETWLVIKPRIRSDCYADTWPDTSVDDPSHTSPLIYETP